MVARYLDVLGLPYMMASSERRCMKQCNVGRGDGARLGLCGISAPRIQGFVSLTALGSWL